MTKTIRILLCDDHSVLRACVKELLVENPCMEIVAEADSGQAAVQQARELKPDFVLMDVSLPDMNGILATRKILSQEHKPKVLAFSLQAHQQTVHDMFFAGAAGYLLKGCSGEELIKAIQTVMAGNRYLGKGIDPGEYSMLDFPR